MPRWTYVITTLSLAAVACSGRYRVGEAGLDVGSAGTGGAGSTFIGMGGSSDAGLTSGSGSGMSAGSGSGTSTGSGSGTSTGSGLGMNAGNGEIVNDETCARRGAPAPLSGPFVPPEVWWSRVARLVWGQDIAPTALPAEMTYSGALSLVLSMFRQAEGERHSFPGAGRFVDEWLRLYDGGDAYQGALTGGWESLLAAPTVALTVLLQSNRGDGRVGVFAEQAFLARHPTISSRGAAIARSLLDIQVPPPPVALPNNIDPILPDRVALEHAVSAAPCAACHQVFDPLAYPLGHFDAMGSFRDRDHGEPIDMNGSYRLGTETVIQYGNLPDFGQQVAVSCTANRALAKTFLEVALIINEVPFENRETLMEQNSERMAQAFVASGRSYEDLVISFAQSPVALLP